MHLHFVRASDFTGICKKRERSFCCCCLTVHAILVKSVVLFPSAEFIPVPEIGFNIEMGQIKISVYFVCLKFRPTERDVVMLLTHNWALYNYLLSGKDTKHFHLEVCVCDMHRYDAFLKEKLLMELWQWTFFSRRIKVH